MKKSKTLILAGFALASLAPGAFAAGGIHGGGGGTVVPDPISIYEVSRQIQDGFLDLRLLTRYWDWARTNLPVTALPTVEKLYGGTTTLVDVLETTRVEILYDKPCISPTGEEVDGSAPGSAPNTICMSAARISQKVSDETARSQILALMLHELSHLLGTTEDEADALQNYALFTLKQSSHENADKLVANINSQLDAANTALHAALLGLKSGDSGGAIKNLEIANSNFRTYDLAIGGNFNIQSAIEDAGFELHALQLMVELWSASAASTQPDALYWRQTLDDVFQGQNSVTLETFRLRHFHSTTTNGFAKELITRPQSNAEMIGAVERIAAYLSRVQHELRALVMNSERTQVALPVEPVSVNPWEQFVGVYKITNRTCEDHGVAMYLNSDTAIEIFKEANGKVKFKRISNSGYGVMGDLETGGSFMFGDSHRVTSSAPGQATFESVDGSYYCDNRSVYRLEMKTTATGPVLVNTSERWAGNIWSGTGPTVGYGVCSYQLEKQ